MIAQHRHRESCRGRPRPSCCACGPARPVHGRRGQDADRAAARLHRAAGLPPARRAGRFALSVEERVQFARPSIDVLFESAADAYGSGLIGIILTGANADGAAGLAPDQGRAAASRSSRIRRRGRAGRCPTPRSPPPSPTRSAARGDRDVPLRVVRVRRAVVPRSDWRAPGPEDRRAAGRRWPTSCSSTTAPRTSLALEAILEPLGPEPHHRALGRGGAAGSSCATTSP